MYIYLTMSMISAAAILRPHRKLQHNDTDKFSVFCVGLQSSRFGRSKGIAYSKSQV